MRLIDADALKKKARYVFKSNTGGHIPPIVSTDDIDNAPTIEAEPVRYGHWYIAEYEYFGCSVCGGTYYNGCDCSSEARDILRNGDTYHYCPNCGARMDGEIKTEG